VGVKLGSSEHQPGVPIIRRRRAVVEEEEECPDVRACECVHKNKGLYENCRLCGNVVAGLNIIIPLWCL
jgi:hypothetical protein